MAKKPGLNWQTVSIRPLTGELDTRSRPADIVAGGFRWRMNFATTDENKICCRDGYSKLFSDITPWTNYDHHHQGTTREPITLLYESTDSEGTRRLFDGTQSRVSLLDYSTGLWADIISGQGDTGSRWKCAQLNDYILFSNNVNQVAAYELSTATLTQPIPALADAPFRDSAGNSVTGKALTAARVIVEFRGVILLMNVFQDGKRYASRVTWCDFNSPLSWVIDPNNSIAGFQDLDYGDDILAAAEISGALYIYTASAIWRSEVNTDPNSASAFAFKRIYREPKNKAGCLAFPNTLVSTGDDHYYAARDGIYHFNQYLSAPERIDWIHKASGVVYKNAVTALDAKYCDSPVSEYRAIQKEVWISWPSSGQQDNNNWTLVLNIDQKAADIVDAGFTAFVNFRPQSSSSTEQCNESQTFIGASGGDWCLKDVGNGVFSREIATATVIANDLPLDNSSGYLITGYYRILRGIVPLGLNDREKIVRNILIDSDETPQADPCVVRMRIGNSRNLVDANDSEDFCSPLWRQLDDVSLKCIEDKTNTELSADNQRSSIEKNFPCYDQGNFLYFELTIANADGSPAIGGDSCLQRIDFDSAPLPKP